MPGEHIEALALSREAEDLASAYIADGAMGARMQAVNLKRGYPLLDMRTPREVPGDD